MDYGEGTSSGMTAIQLMKQSFNRFDETLVENILSYLTLNEKVLFESISKQWGKCIYNKQTALHLTRWDSEDNDSVNKILEPIDVIDFTTGSAVANGLKKVNKYRLKSILKKCKSIEKVFLDCFLDFEDLDIIGRNCPKLKSIVLDTTGLSATDFDHFGQRYGLNFERVQFTSMFSANYVNMFFIHSKNLKYLSSPNGFQFSCENRDYLPNLEEVENYQIYQNPDNSDENLKKFEKFCNKFSETMKRLCVSAYIDMNDKYMDSFFDSISKLKNLKDLDVFAQSVNVNDDGLDKHIRQVSKNCPEIKKMKIVLYATNLKINKLFYGFEDFKNLIKLDLYISCQTDTEVIPSKLSLEGSVRCLQSSKNLKYLMLSIETISEEFFEDIHTYLPNLSTLIIGSETEITDKTISQLKHLKRLKEFHLNKFKNSNKQITDESICSVINSCPALKMIYFGSRPNITNKTIETLIDCANSYPKRVIHFECGSSEAGDENDFETIDMISFIDKIPENLTINIVMNNNNEE